MNLPTAGSTVLLASRATCMRPTRMWAMSEVRPGWISTTCETQRGVNTSGVQLIVNQISMIVFHLTILNLRLYFAQLGQCYLGSPVGLGDLARSGDGMSKDFSVVRYPGTADAFQCLRVRILL